MMITAAQQDTKQMVEYHKVKFGSALLLLALLCYLLPRNPSVSAFETYTDADADAMRRESFTSVLKSKTIFISFSTLDILWC